MLTKIEVKQEHIDNGWRITIDSCPVSLAINDVLKEDFKTYIGATPNDTNDGIITACFILNIQTRVATVVMLPEFTGKFIVDYDAECGVSPFSFEIDIPDEMLK